MKSASANASYPPAQQGIALILVLWVIALMTVIALSVASLSRTEVSLARTRVDEARIRALADAATVYAALRLSAEEEDDRWLPDGSPRPLSFAGYELQISVFNEPSRVDLNKASEEVLEQLIGAMLERPADAEPLVAAILDWRDADDSERPLGAESNAYRAAGLPYGTSNAPFKEAAELGQVLGFTQELTHRLLPYLTVSSANGQVQMDYAAPFLREALGEDAAPPTARDAYPDDVSSDDKERNNSRDPEAAGGGGPRGGPVYRIRAVLADGGPAMETLVRLGGRGVAMDVIWRRLDWRGGAAVH